MRGIIPYEPFLLYIQVLEKGGLEKMKGCIDHKKKMIYFKTKQQV